MVAEVGIVVERERRLAVVLLRAGREALEVERPGEVDQLLLPRRRPQVQRRPSVVVPMLHGRREAVHPDGRRRGRGPPPSPAAGRRGVAAVTAGAPAARRGR